MTTGPGNSGNRGEDGDPDGDDYLCLGVCQPDEEGACCIGCGRPWHLRAAPDWDTLRLPPEDSAGEDAPPDAAA